MQPRRFFGEDALDQARAWLRAEGVARPLLLCGPSRRFVDDVALPGAVGVFDRARVHVPRDVVDAAIEAAAAHKADAIVSLGGGSPTGLAKVLRLRTGLPFLALPTTYAGSEMTRIYAITEASEKTTERDDGVRPGAIAYVPAFLDAMPAALTVQSLMNALAHAVAADDAGETARGLFRAILKLAERPQHRAARLAAARGASAAAALLDGGALGMHHKVAHVLGGKFDLPHAPLHSVLLPHSMGTLALPEADPPAALFDALRIVGAPTSIAALRVDPNEAVAAVRERLGDVAWIEAAALGRRPSLHVQRVSWDGGPPLSVFGDVHAAHTVLLAVHGRGATADAILMRAREILGDATGVAIVAPQADGAGWYGCSYRTALQEAAADVDAAVARVEAAHTWIERNAPTARVHLFGFSQGACVALETAARSARPFASVTAIAGARPGPPPQQRTPSAALRDVPVLLGASRTDRWLDADAVAECGRAMQSAGAEVSVVMEPGGAHELSVRQRLAAHDRWVGPTLPSYGFGNAHHVEARAGAVPQVQNQPRRGPYGLYPENVSGTGFVAPRHDNRRNWLYRIRPSAGHRPFSALAHSTLRDDFVGRRPEVNLSGWGPLPIPDDPTDFVDGMHTIGGHGSAAARRGFAIHVYAANRSMQHRSFYDADGDLLFVPEQGRILLQTEQGILDVPPGHIAVVPRGLRFRVLLSDDSARGYVGEVFARHFELPERGVIGANGLADERHFRTPAPFFEDRLDPGHRLTAKHGGALYETTLDRSPYDVVGWHGNYTPYAYDLAKFSPVSNVAFDHIDPSAYLVLTSPLDEHGADSLDLVVFPARWDPTAHTFRPPFFHRNAITEFNGIVRDPGSAPFRAGMSFLTPAMTAHGVIDRAVERAIDMNDERADRPVQNSAHSLWFQFETSTELALTRWAETTELRIADWPDVWGRYRSYYAP